MNKSIIALDSVGPTPQVKASGWEDAQEKATDWDKDLTLHKTTHGDLTPVLTANGMGLRDSDGFGVMPLDPWAYGQLCATMATPVGFLRKLDQNLQLEILRDRWKSVPGDTVRHVRSHDGENISAVLGPRFSPIDYAPTVRMVQNMFPDALLREATFGSLMMNMRATLPSPIVELPTGPVFGALEFRNSEVGFSAWEILFSLYVQVCSNGMTMRVGGKRSLFKCLHVGWDEEKLRKAVEAVDPVAQADQELVAIERMIDRARKDTPVWTPDDVRNTLVKTVSPRARKAREGEDVNGRTHEIYGYRPSLQVAEDVADFFVGQEQNLWGLTQAITAVSQLQPIHVRAELDEWAGRILSKGLIPRAA